MVDTVLYFEGERDNQFRILRWLKIDLVQRAKLVFFKWLKPAYRKLQTFENALEGVRMMQLEVAFLQA